MHSTTQVLGALAFACAACCPAQAGTAAANLGVSATVGSSCIITATPVAFGLYNPAAGSPADSSGGIAVTCTTGTTYSVSLDAGASPSAAGSIAGRRMTAGAAKFLAYQLYLDGTYATVWGDGTGGSSVNPASGSSTGTGAAQTHTVFGRIGAGSFVPAGTYVDTVVATVTYN
jgi:spore coat protein U-like protein